MSDFKDIGSVIGNIDDIEKGRMVKDAYNLLLGTIFLWNFLLISLMSLLA